MSIKDSDANEAPLHSLLMTYLSREEIMKVPGGESYLSNKEENFLKLRKSNSPVSNRDYSE